MLYEFQTYPELNQGGLGYLRPERDIGCVAHHSGRMMALQDDRKYILGIVSE